ncbi:MAG TPA: hypothetical protein VFI68_01515, partial [Anaerolineales bacterium]|nr:hypothetical protein [Anaerolineales bacterium]
LGAFAMSLCIFGWLYLGRNSSMWILAPAGVMLGGSVYFAALWILRVPELQYMVSGVLRRLKLTRSPRT